MPSTQILSLCSSLFCLSHRRREQGGALVGAMLGLGLMWWANRLNLQLPAPGVMDEEVRTAALRFGLQSLLGAVVLAWALGRFVSAAEDWSESPLLSRLMPLGWFCVALWVLGTFLLFQVSQVHPSWRPHLAEYAVMLGELKKPLFWLSSLVAALFLAKHARA